jgi:hypothetical protein
METGRSLFLIFFQVARSPQRVKNKMCPSSVVEFFLRLFLELTTIALAWPTALPCVPLSQMTHSGAG